MATFPTLVGRPNQEGKKSGLDLPMPLVGRDLLSKRDLLHLKYVKDRGMVQNWNEMEMLWDHAFSRVLEAEPSEHPVLTSNLLYPLSGREKTLMIMFETFDTPAVQICYPPFLALQGNGMETGVIVECGGGTTHVASFVDGNLALRKAVQRAPFGGKDVTDHLVDLMRERGYTLDQTVSMRQSVREMKESECFVADDYEGHLQRSEWSAEFETEYTFPDGEKCVLGSERYRSTEILFNPSLADLEYPGIPEMIYNSIERCPESNRELLYASVVLSGGNSMLPGFAPRIKKELNEFVSAASRVEIEVAPETRATSVWRGGSVVSLLGSRKDSWMTKEEYDEAGPSIHRRKFSLGMYYE